MRTKAKAKTPVVDEGGRPRNDHGCDRRMEINNEKRREIKKNVQKKKRIRIRVASCIPCRCTCIPLSFVSRISSSWTEVVDDVRKLQGCEVQKDVRSGTRDASG